MHYGQILWTCCGFNHWLRLSTLAIPQSHRNKSSHVLTYLGDELPARLDAPALGADVVLEVAVVRRRRQRRRSERSHDEEAVRGLPLYSLDHPLDFPVVTPQRSVVTVTPFAQLPT